MHELLSMNTTTTTRSMAHNTTRNCEYVLLAEFDIDEGSTLRHEYPTPTGCDGHLLAELMLPDGAHLRTEDWTVFYLNQTAATAVRSESKGDEKGGETAGTDELSNPKGKDLLYTMSLVRTKHGSAFKRGALVKALAVCSRHPYIQIFKPILLLALEDYFSDPSPAILKRLYDAINAIDTSLAPQLSLDERQVLRHSERKDLFEEKFLYPDDGGKGDDAATLNGRQTPTPASILQDNSEARRQTIYDGLPGEQQPRTRVASNSSAHAASPHVQQPGQMQRSLSRTKGLRDTHYFDTSVFYNGLNLPIRLPLATFPNEVGDYSLITLIQTFSNFTGTQGSLHPHLHTNGSLTPPIIVLFNALITYKRVLFLGGSGQPAGQVSNFVLAAAALASGCGMFFGADLTERCFPYSNLTNLDNQLAVPGYIAGVSNPRFEDLTSTWDVLCNIETGRIHISKDIQQASSSSFSSASNASQLSLSTSSTATHTSGAAGSSGPAGSYEMSISPEPMSAVSGVMPFSQHGQGIQDGLGMTASNSDGDLGKSAHSGKEPAAAAPTKIETRLDSSDVLFMDEIVQAIQSHFGEAVVRARITDYVRRFVRLASRWEEETFGATSIDHPSVPYTSTTKRPGSGLVFTNGGSPEEVKRELHANTGRIEGWRRTKCYEAYKADWIARQQDPNKPVKGCDLHHQISRLRLGKKMSNDEVEAVLRTLRDTIRSDEQIIQLLTHLPSHFGGLLPLAFGLFHPLASVRDCTVDILNTLNAHATGSKFVSSMNAFHRLAYTRLASEQASSTPQQYTAGHTRQPSGNSAMSFNIAMRQGLEKEFAAASLTAA